MMVDIDIDIDWGNGSRGVQQKNEPRFVHEGEDNADDEADASPRQVTHDLCGPRRRWMAAGILVVIAVVITVSVVATKGNRAPYEPYATVQPEQEELFTLITEALDDTGAPDSDFLLKEGYQYKAFDWLSKNKNLDDMDRLHKLQRYALAALYFSTNNVGHDYEPNPGPWLHEELWLSEEFECDWTHVHCDLENKVQMLLFKDNNLSGKIPQDLGLLGDSLHTLDVTSNSIYMDDIDFAVFDNLPNLKVLEMKENYMYSEDGLPQNIESLEDLEKLVASNNNFYGPMDNGVLNSLQKLTHLEIEDTFLTGALPFLEEMPELVSVYLRNNDLTSHLNFLKSTQLTNLNKIWVDDNKITQTIPTQVGHLTSLASMSVTNAELTGTIPTEFAILPLLHKLWLNGNNLSGTIPDELASLTNLAVFEVQNNDITGSMPSGVCDIIQQSDYEDRSLVADCSQVDCEDCCTECQ